MRRPLSLALLLVSLPSILFAQSPAPDIWGRTILPQPFDAQPFREIKIPAWVQDTIGCGYTLSAMDRAARERAARPRRHDQRDGLRRPVLRLLRQQAAGAAQPARAAWSDCPRTSPSTSGWACASWESIPLACKAKSTRSIPTGGGSTTNTTDIPAIDLEKFPHGGMLCLLGPYGDFFIDVLAEIVTTFPDVDAFSFDGLHYGGVCYCQHCRENYRHDTGGEIPNVDMNDPAFRRYQHWADRRMEDLVRRMQTRLKANQARGGPGDLDHQRRTVRPLPRHPAQHAGADEPAAGRARPGILARRNEPRHHDRAGLCQRLHLGDDEPPRGLQRTVHR